MRVDRGGDPGADLGHLLDEDALGDLVGADPAVLLGEDDPQEPQLTEHRQDLDRELLVALRLLDQRSDLRLGELADHLAQVVLLLREGVAQHSLPRPGRGPSARPRRRRDRPSLPADVAVDCRSVSDPFRLDGRTVIVTGASRGIGAEVAACHQRPRRRRRAGRALGRGPGRAVGRPAGPQRGGRGRRRRHRGRGGGRRRRRGPRRPVGRRQQRRHQPLLPPGHRDAAVGVGRGPAGQPAGHCRLLARGRAVPGRGRHGREDRQPQLGRRPHRPAEHRPLQRVQGGHRRAHAHPRGRARAGRGAVQLGGAGDDRDRDGRGADDRQPGAQGAAGLQVAARADRDRRRGRAGRSSSSSPTPPASSPARRWWSTADGSPPARRP